MTGKQNAIFWIGLFMILVNFWISGQSTVLWQTLTLKGPLSATTTPKRSPKSQNPGSPGSQVGGGIPHVQVPPFP